MNRKKVVLREYPYYEEAEDTPRPNKVLVDVFSAVSGEYVRREKINLSDAEVDYYEKEGVHPFRFDG